MHIINIFIERKQVTKVLDNVREKFGTPHTDMVC